MKTTKLVTGILSMILFVLVAFQSCAAGLSNALQENGEVGGSGGILLAILMLAGGIVAVATRSKIGKGGSIACLILYGLAALFGFVLAGSYGDLYIWAGWCLICAVLHLVSIIKKPKVN